MRAGPRESLKRVCSRSCAMLSRRGAWSSSAISLNGRDDTATQRVQPYGVLYGNRAFLVGRTDWANDTRLWRLANMSDARITDETFERDPAFDLQRYAKRSFGTFQEERSRLPYGSIPAWRRT